MRTRSHREISGRVRMGAPPRHDTKVPSSRHKYPGATASLAGRKSQSALRPTARPAHHGGGTRLDDGAGVDTERLRTAGGRARSITGGMNTCFSGARWIRSVDHAFGPRRVSGHSEEPTDLFVGEAEVFADLSACHSACDCVSRCVAVFAVGMFPSDRGGLKARDMPFAAYGGLSRVDGCSAGPPAFYAGLCGPAFKASEADHRAV